MALTSNILGTVNFVGFLLSIPLIGAGIWLISKQDTECLKFLEWPLILFGVIVLLVSLAGFIGAFWRVTSLLSIYLFGMVLIILVLLALTIFGLVVTNDGPGADAAYRNYKVEEYSSWLQSQVDDVFNWRKIKSCMRDEGICEKLQENYYYTTAKGFYSERFSSIEVHESRSVALQLCCDFLVNIVILLLTCLRPSQYGCCMPPADCGFQYVNPTYWISPTKQFAEPDCSRWSNTESQLCYDCDSCRAGILARVKEEWRKVSVLGLVILIGLIILYVIACCAIQSARNEELFKHYRRGY